MAEYREYLAILDSDPTNDQALAELEKLVPMLDSLEAQSALEETREALRERGLLDIACRLYDMEIQAAQDVVRRADLLRKKGHLYVDDLLDEKGAVECFRRVLELRPDDEDTQEVLSHLELLRENWRKVVNKYLDEARGSTDRQLTTGLYLSAAETTARYAPDAPEVEQHLRAALDVDPGNRRAAIHLERILRQAERWAELAELLDRRAAAADDNDERIAALVALAELASGPLERPELAAESMKKVVALEPGHPRALSLLSDVYQREENWSALVMLYTGALKARRRGAGAAVEIGTLLQIAMLHWKRLDNLEAAEEYFRRVRKVDPAHPAALEFYREYLPPRGDAGQLVQIYRQAQKAVPDSDRPRRRELAVATAEICENDLKNPEKAIDAWKVILRGEPDAADARAALARLYGVTEKWNALLDLMKDEIERRPADDVEGRIAGLLKVVEIYRDRIKLDVMAINTYNAILALDPTHREAIDSLAAKYRERSQWNDLITILGKKAELPGLSQADKIGILRQIASLWIERFGNYAQAIKPLEQLLELSPGDPVAIASLKDIYGRRRQWRALIGLLGREADQLPRTQRRRHLVEMAQLAAERLGDSRLAIEIWNRVLELCSVTGEAEPDADASGEAAAALAALAALYERDKRHLALADVYRRQHRLAKSPAEGLAALERLGALLSDKLDARPAAAEVYQEILHSFPDHPRAARTLREIYSAQGDHAALEAVYAELGQWDELVEALQAIADRVDDRATRLDLYQRAAQVAAEHGQSADRVARAWERLLSIEPRHLRAAQALAPIYEKSGKSARLLAIYEILLDHADSDEARLELLGEIRTLCEERLGSKALAFQWAGRAYRLRPDDPALLAELERLGAEADAWDEVAVILDERAGSEAIGDAERIRVLRELGRIAAVRLHQPDRAQTYWERVLGELPEDAEALAALEEIATQQSDWPDLLKIYRRRAKLEKDTERQVDLLFRVAFLEEERLADLDAAVATYRRILDLDAGSRRALKALAKLCEARSDWAGLADALERELDQGGDSDAAIALLVRLGGLYQNDLDQPDRALGCYKRALALSPSAQIHRLLEGFLGEDRAPEVRREVAELLLPAYDEASDAERIARAIEILRQDAAPEARLEYDRRLMALYGQRLGRADLAYQAGLRVLEREPGKSETREELLRLADLNGALADLADHLELVLTEQDDKGPDEVDPTVVRALSVDSRDPVPRRAGRPRAVRAGLAPGPGHRPGRRPRAGRPRAHLPHRRSLGRPPHPVRGTARAHPRQRPPHGPAVRGRRPERDLAGRRGRRHRRLPARARGRPGAGPGPPGARAALPGDRALGRSRGAAGARAGLHRRGRPGRAAGAACAAAGPAPRRCPRRGGPDR